MARDRTYTDSWLQSAEWTSGAACAKAPLTIDFFPDEPAVTEREHSNVARAKAFCAVCPIQQKCFDRAMKSREPGIWGGTTGRERKALRDRERLAVKKSKSGQQVLLPADVGVQ